MTEMVSRLDEKHAPAPHARAIPQPLADTKAQPGEHMLTIDEAMKRFDTNLKTGLTTAAVAARLARDGPNVLSPPKQLSPAMKFVRELFSGFAGILWIAALLAFIAWKPLGEPNPDPGNLTLGIVLLFVIVFQAAFNFYQEYQSSKVLESFRSMLSTRATVIRNGGTISEIPASELVLGDIVKVAMGQNAPADMLLFRANNLKIDKASITGASEPVEATVTAQPSQSSDAPQSFVEASNLALMGTRIVEGDGAGVVIRIGDQCAVASIVRLASLDTEQTTLHKEIAHFVKIIVAAAVLVAVAGAITWGAWLNVKYGDDSPAVQAGGVPFLTAPQLLANLIGMIVAFVPEGLPISVTMTLSLIAYRLVHRYRVLVTKLGTVETLGAVSLLASDKTGTITENKMTVRRLITFDRAYDSNVAAEDVQSSRSPIIVNHLLRDAVLCNAVDVDLERKQPSSVGGSDVNAIAAGGSGETVYLPNWRPTALLARTPSFDANRQTECSVVGARFTHLASPPAGASAVPQAPQALEMIGGGALDRALITFASGRVSVRRLRQTHPRVIEMPFNSATKVMISVHRTKPHAGPSVPPATAAAAASPVASAIDAPLKEMWLSPELKAPTVNIEIATPIVAGVISSPPLPALAPVKQIAPAGTAARSKAMKPGHFLCVVKGAPEYIVERCKTRYTEVSGAIEEVEFTRSQADDVLRQAEVYAGNGERLIAVAEITLPTNEFPIDFQFNTNPPNFPVTELCFVGLVAVMDPPRADVPQAVYDCQQASIQVCMITGDHPATAQAIARQVGIIRSPLEKVLTWAEAKRVPMVFGVDEAGRPIVPDCSCCGATCPWCPTNCTSCWSKTTDPVTQAVDRLEARMSSCDACASGNPSTAADAVGVQLTTLADVEANLSINVPAPVHRKRNRLQNLALVVTGAELRTFTVDDWERVFRFEQLVFARTTPDQKLKIVSEAQRLGYIVAVTGDGVNDAPALKKANVGVAMGAATEVAQASADIVLQNNDFASIVRGIEQGRVVFDNLKKVIMYLLPAGSFSELMPVVVTIWIGAPTALSGFLMVIICVFTDVFASLALVHEPAELDLMRREPRDPARHRLVDWKLILYAYGYIGLMECFIAFLAFGLFLRENAPAAILDSGGPALDTFGAADWLGVFNNGVSIPSEILFRGQSIFFVMLVMCQIGNLLTTRTRIVPILKLEWFGLTSKLTAANGGAHVAPPTVVVQPNGGVALQPASYRTSVPSVRENRWVPIVCACVASIVTAIVITEGQWVNVRRVPIQWWGAGVLGGVAIFLMGEFRKWWFNLWPDGFVSRLAW